MSWTTEPAGRWSSHGGLTGPMRGLLGGRRSPIAVSGRRSAARLSAAAERLLCTVRTPRAPSPADIGVSRTVHVSVPQVWSRRHRPGPATLSVRISMSRSSPKCSPVTERCTIQSTPYSAIWAWMPSPTCPARLSHRRGRRRSALPIDEAGVSRRTRLRVAGSRRFGPGSGVCGSHWGRWPHPVRPRSWAASISARSSPCGPTTQTAGLSPRHEVSPAAQVRRPNLSRRPSICAVRPRVPRQGPFLDE